MGGISRSALAVATICGVAMASVPGNAKTMKLTAIGAPPPIVLPVKVTKEFFIPEVNKRLAASGKDFKIEWTEAYSSSLAKFSEVFEATEEGIGHLGVNIWVFEGSKLPLENVTFYVPFGTTDSVGLTKVMRNLHQKIPEMDKTYENYNQVHLVSWGADPYQLVTKFPVTKWEDLKGHKLGASGTMGQFFRNTGSAVVTSSMLDAYTSIKNGVYEGYTATIGLIFPYKMYQAAPHITKVNFGATSGSGLTLNRDTWNDLPAHAKKIFKEVAWETGLLYSRMSEKRIAKFEPIMRKRGAKIADFPAEERKRWAYNLPNIAKEWAARLDKRGQPGTKLLKAYMDELRALPGANKDIVRHWDRE